MCKSSMVTNESLVLEFKLIPFVLTRRVSCVAMLLVMEMKQQNQLLVAALPKSMVSSRVFLGLPVEFQVEIPYGVPSAAM
ncbi:hypothetical protein L2E82_16385 [Cichorium intybus]|uniref:Uncharacterized protein n=1 Tax=Cichorium intybus TaxID=13427 RepID=A0ACB9F6L4_CICIN|nr:hypothetical protein L2E82_16385 [Cichorium intybus]